MRQLVLVMLIVLPTIMLSSASPLATGQQTPPTDRPQRVVVVDGKTNPELVNRDLLVAQILGAMAIPASATAEDERRLQLHAAAIGLGRADEQVLRAEMIRLHAEIAPIRSRLRATPVGDVAPREVPILDLQAYRDARLQSYGRLLELLSRDGREKLNTFIEQQKRNTKVVGTARSQQ